MKKWQEIEFLDFKERQTRRRLSKSRQVRIQLEEAAPAASGLKFVAVTALMAVVLGVGGFLYWQHKESLRVAELARRVELVVTEVKGEVEFSTATTPFAPLAVNAHMTETFTVRQGANSRCTIATSLPGSRLVVIDKSQVEIGKPVADSHDGESPLLIKAAVKLGTLMCDFRKGRPRVEVKLPGDVAMRGENGMYKVVVDEAGSSTVLVREAFVNVRGPKKVGAVKLDERLVISASGEFEKAQKFQTPETVWK